MRKIVVGVDGSPQSEAALRWAITEATPGQDTICAVLVRSREELLPGTSYAIQPHGRRPVADDETYAALLHATVHRAVEELDNPPPVTEVVVNGDPAAQLISQSVDADLLVIGSHGARPITELLLGGVSTQCVRRAHCPVVVITVKSAQRRP